MCIFVVNIYGIAQQPDILDTVKIISSDIDSIAEFEEQVPINNKELVSLYRPVPVDTLNAINRDSRFYYKNYMDSLLRASKKAAKKKPESTGFFKTLYELIIWVGAIIVVGFLLYRLFFSNASLFVRNRSAIQDKTKKDENEFPADLDSLVQNAIRVSNYRLAIRYLYLRALQDLSNRGYIEIAAAKTNFQYVSEINRQSFAKDFAALTLKYEYVWYGEYPVDEILFSQIQAGFKAFNKRIIK